MNLVKSSTKNPPSSSKKRKTPQSTPPPFDNQYPQKINNKNPNSPGLNLTSSTNNETDEISPVERLIYCFNYVIIDWFLKDENEDKKKNAREKLYVIIMFNYFLLEPILNNSNVLDITQTGGNKSEDPSYKLSYKQIIIILFLFYGILYKLSTHTTTDTFIKTLDNDSITPARIHDLLKNGVGRNLGDVFVPNTMFAPTLNTILMPFASLERKIVTSNAYSFFFRNYIDDEITYKMQVLVSNMNLMMRKDMYEARQGKKKNDKDFWIDQYRTYVRMKNIDCFAKKGIDQDQLCPAGFGPKAIEYTKSITEEQYNDVRDKYDEIFTKDIYKQGFPTWMNPFLNAFSAKFDENELMAKVGNNMLIIPNLIENDKGIDLFIPKADTLTSLKRHFSAFNKWVNIFSPDKIVKDPFLDLGVELLMSNRIKITLKLEFETLLMLLTKYNEYCLLNPQSDDKRTKAAKAFATFVIDKKMSVKDGTKLINRLSLLFHPDSKRNANAITIQKKYFTGVGSDGISKNIQDFSSKVYNDYIDIPGSEILYILQDSKVILENPENQKTGGKSKKSKTKKNKTKKNKTKKN
jgi:hypothetical protein